MKVSEIIFSKETYCDGENNLYSAKTEFGRITVLDRLTGYGGGMRDTETGYRDLADKFWLASSMFDIREYPNLELDEAIELIKKHSNTCVGE